MFIFFFSFEIPSTLNRFERTISLKNDVKKKKQKLENGDEPLIIESMWSTVERYGGLGSCFSFV